jgi:hypothetical protein
MVQPMVQPMSRRQLSWIASLGGKRRGKCGTEPSSIDSDPIHSINRRESNRI